MKAAWFGAAALAAAMAVPAVAAQSSGARFVTKAMKANNSEVMLGKLAASNASDADVRAFGTTLVTDHTKGKAQAAAVARRIGVAPTDAVMPDATAERAKLDKLHGAAFDREFVRFMVNDHKKDIAEFEAESHKTKDGAAATLATNTLPVLRKHLRIAERLSARH